MLFVIFHLLQVGDNEKKKSVIPGSFHSSFLVSMDASTEKNSSFLCSILPIHFMYTLRCFQIYSSMISYLHFDVSRFTLQCFQIYISMSPDLHFDVFKFTLRRFQIYTSMAPDLHFDVSKCTLRYFQSHFNVSKFTLRCFQILL